MANKSGEYSSCIIRCASTRYIYSAVHRTPLLGHVSLQRHVLQATGHRDLTLNKELEITLQLQAIQIKFIVCAGPIAEKYGPSQSLIMTSLPQLQANDFG